MLKMAKNKNAIPETGICDAKQLGVPKMLVLGFQHLFAMFGATVLVPLLTGLDVATTLLMAGLGTLLFHRITKFKVPAFLGSSFAFLGGYAAVAPVDGANGMAGEIGHVRMTEDGPVGYGKPGSAEGYCSGGGIAKLGKKLAKEALDRGEVLPYCKNGNELSNINAKLLADHARNGEPIAKQVYDVSGEMLGRALAILIDLVNPEKIVIGSIFVRCEDLLRPNMEKVLEKEALSLSRSVCEIVGAELSEQIGDFAALAVAETKGGK
jgi:hypothetical protein